MDITKSNWIGDADTFCVSMPMSKVDKENRLVSGWASLDNIDLQKDRVLAEASEKAFGRFRGNIREMHQPIAVGRMVSYRPDTYYDEKTQKFYNGIFATVYVSKGAESTWEKVLDGTLSAFSIKGPIIESEMEFSKDAGGPVRIVKDYDLEELSLVDSGGNQYANVVSIMKVNGETQVTGMIVDTKSENVFYCDKHESPVAKTSTEEGVECLEGHKMQNIGWIEYDDSNKAEKVSEVVAKYNSTNNNAEQVQPATNEGGVDVAESTEKKVVEGSAALEEVSPAEQGKAETEVLSSNEVADNAEVQTQEENVEEATDVSEVKVDDKPDFAKMFDGFKEVVLEGITKSNAATAEAIGAVSASVDAKVAELTKVNEDLATKFDSLQNELAGMKKSLDAVESETAVKKSGDLGGSTDETLEKSNRGSKHYTWSGAFLGSTDDE